MVWFWPDRKVPKSEDDGDDTDETKTEEENEHEDDGVEYEVNQIANISFIIINIYY